MPNSSPAPCASNTPPSQSRAHCMLRIGGTAQEALLNLLSLSVVGVEEGGCVGVVVGVEEVVHAMLCFAGGGGWLVRGEPVRSSAELVPRNAESAPRGWQPCCLSWPNPGCRVIGVSALWGRPKNSASGKAGSQNRGLQCPWERLASTWGWGGQRWRGD